MKKEKNDKFVVRLILGIILALMAVVYGMYYIPLIRSNSSIESFGKFIQFFVIECTLGWWAIKFGSDRALYKFTKNNSAGK